jgi:hypothetical protein
MSDLARSNGGWWIFGFGLSNTIVSLFAKVRDDDEYFASVSDQVEDSS